MNPSINEEVMKVGCEALEEAPALLKMAAQEGLKVNGIRSVRSDCICELALYLVSFAISLYLV